MATTMQQHENSDASPLTVLLVSMCAAALTGAMALKAPSTDTRILGWAGLVLFSFFVLAAIPRLLPKKSKALEEVYATSNAQQAVLSVDEIADRLPIWEAIAELWLDIEMKQGEIKYIAQRLAQSKYSMAELEGILLYEVAPVVHLNLRDTEGEQRSFPIHWLENEILKHLKKAGDHRVTAEEEAHLTEYVSTYWEKVKEHIHEYWRAGV